jgi:hypothetical protein
VAYSMAWERARVEGAGPGAPGREVMGAGQGRLAVFREELYRCFTARADELFELAESVLCAGGPVRVLAGLSLAPEHRRGHGALYDGLSHGGIEVARLRRALSRLPLLACLMGGSGWRSMSATGCGRTRPPPRRACSATAMAAARRTRR